MGMGTVRSFRVGCGMISRGEVGLIVTAMGASTGIFKEPEVAVMVTVVLLTTSVHAAHHARRLHDQVPPG